MMDGLRLLELLRHPIELLLGIAVFLLPNYRRTNKNWLYFSLLVVVVSAVIALLLAIAESSQPTHEGSYVTPIWGISSSVITYLLFLGGISCLIQWIFDVSKNDIIYIVLAGFVLQHIVYLLVHGLMAEVFFRKWFDDPLLHLVITIVVLLVIYRVAYQLFAPEMRLAGRGNLCPSSMGRFLYLGMLILFTGQTMMNQSLLLREGENTQFIAVLASLVLCIMVLYAQYMTLHSDHLSADKMVLEQLLDERQKQYRMEKEAVEFINFKSHDLKNQLLALQSSEDQEVYRFYNEAIALIQQYDQVINVENETLNTLLTQKQYVCQKADITLTFMIDGKLLSFIDKVDLYTILGNALDNAIEHVREIEDLSLKQISLQIFKHGGYLVMKVSNPLVGILQIDEESGLPNTIKSDKHSHGLGLRSIQLTLERYQGWMSIDSSQEIFSLSMMLPFPSMSDKPV